jgi:flagellar biosynthesis/type III secretory pathway protein FliH
MCTCSLSTHEVEVGGSFEYRSLRPAWATYQDPVSKERKERKKEGRKERRKEGRREGGREGKRQGREGGREGEKERSKLRMTNC